MFYLTTHSTHFTYGYMASNMVKYHSDCERKPAAATWATSFLLTARVILYTPSHRQDSLCYTNRGALAEMRNTIMEMEARLIIIYTS